MLAAVGSIPHVYANNEPASRLFQTPQSSAQLLSAVEGTGDLTSVPLALHIVLHPGWKTYWRAPGDAGYPPQVDVAGSDNVADAQLMWPVPHRFELFGLQTFGYGEEVAFPLMVTPEVPGEPISLKAKIRYLVCEQICVPQEGDLALDLPGGAADPSRFAPLVNRFASLVPKSGERLGWSVDQVAVDQQSQLVIDVKSTGEVLNKPDVIVEGAPHIYFGPPKVELSADRQSARLSVPMERIGNGPDVANSDLILTVFDGDRGMELTARPTAIVSAASISSWMSILPILGIALLGGLILNVMPCVLPVLALKLTGVLDAAGRELMHLRGAFLWTSAGIVTSFLVLAGGLIAVKAGGASVGWGIQFQQPAFLALMAIVCLLFAANIWGLFQIPMPAFVGRVAVASEARVGNDHAKSFFTGVLATALATPCSAPFVGTAVGFALSRGPGEILGIFLALGLGLALPYLAVAAAPRLVTFLPRPGRWMRWLKGLLGLSLVGTAIWLMSIIGTQTGFLSVGAAVRGGSDWIAFDEAAIPDLVAQDKVVFVDVTADWCITCQANKKLVIDRDPVADRLQQDNVVAMRADWTNPDPKIADFLGRHGRYGIPFNIVYGPGAPAGIALPELLTTETVTNALDRAGKR
ncbi:protein-disulfide reductase DsbD family protein [Dongia deserti]|uniref:protein-disulfide reductase DsbD family protein n=1 Tax=Dongia deserti TaxID=2268030 RepID=UPI0025476914|nr:protein-disulfide reductase DsbD domain-containing protein [Dongia deserti]